jgi:hypothetical protein
MNHLIRNADPAAPLRPHRSLRRIGALCLLTVAACGGGGGGGGGGSSTLEQALNTLGVDTTETPRETAPGVLVDSSSSPLGTTPVLARTNELLIMNLGTPPSQVGEQPLMLFDLTADDGSPAAEQLLAQDRTQVPFLDRPQGTSREFPATTTWPVAADMDGDGLEEIVLIYQAGIETRMRRYDDEASGFAMTDVQMAANDQVTNIHALAVDLDGDGKDELVLTLTMGGQGKLSAFRFDGTAFTQLGSTITLPRDLPSGSLTLQTVAGNVDADPRPELAVAIQEVNSTTGSARVLVLDDLANAFATLRDELFVVRDQNQVLQVGLTAAIDCGDIDGDGLDEIVVGGLTRFSRFCEATEHIVTAIDDRQHQFATISSHFFSYFYPGCNSPTDRQVRTIHMNCLDYDGDGVDEVAANQFLFEDFASASPFTEVLDWRLPDHVVWSSSGFHHFDLNTCSFVAGDFDGDDREDLAIHASELTHVEIYGLPATGTTTTKIRELRVLRVGSQFPVNPRILPVNVDTDSPVLRHSEAEYRLIFSEPVVLAALAAPPTQQGIGQNVAASFTAFGNTTSTGSERERSITFSASVSVGVNLDGGPLTQSEFSLKDTLSVAGTRTQGRAYELSRTILFTSAPDEDLVVFTTVPVDQYTFTILSHPDPQLVGQKVIVNYPRTPVTLQAEREFFNRTVPNNAVKIDASVFRHAIGDVSSYPTAAEKNARLGSQSGLFVGPVGVGQGGGSTEVTLQVGSSVSSGGALAVGYERDMEATAGGVLVGVSVGVESENTWRITSGNSTTYTGVVGAIDAANFAANRYSFGLFTYVHRDGRTGQQFQVLNYWVER